VVDRVQANVAPLKSKDRFGRVSRMGAICALPPSEWPLSMIAIHHWRCSAGGSINDQRPLRADSCRPMMHRNARFPPLNPLWTLLPERSWSGLIVAQFVTY
jgi:hypothetical protein